MASSQARGVIYIHSAPRALCPHLEWSVGRALGRAVSFDWNEQPILSGSRRAEFYWEGPAGTGASLATAMRGWEHLRFEVSEDPTPRSDGGRWMHTPGLGIHYAQTDTAGNVVIGEDRVRYALEVAAGDPVELQRELMSHWAPRGTRSSSRSATPATTRRSSGCTRWADRRTQLHNAFHRRSAGGRGRRQGAGNGGRRKTNPGTPRTRIAA